MKLVMVEWLDPCTFASHGWISKEEIDGEQFKPIPCITVGILYQENEDRVVVLLNMNPTDISSAQSIPKSCIKRIRKLRCQNG